MTGKQLKNSILQWAIQGKLVPQDPNDEPASVLLEKIRAEKARLVKEGKIKKDKKESIIYRGEDNSYYEKILATGEMKSLDDEIPFEIPNGWEWCRLSNVFETSSGTTPQSKNPLYYSNGTINWVRTTDLNNGILSSCEVKITPKALTDYNLSIIPQNSICIAMYGGGGTIGKHSIIQFDTTINQSVCAIHPNEMCNMEFVHIFMQFQRPFWMEHAAGSRKDPNINQIIIKNCLIPLPPKNEQDRIVEKYNSLITLLDYYSTVYQQRERLSEGIMPVLKKSILQEAIQGRLVPQVPEDEPASILLERIQQEKNRLLAQGKLKKKDIVNAVIFRGDDNKYFEKKGKDSICIDEEIPFDIPDTWSWTRLSNVAEIYTGNSISETEKKAKYTNVVGRYYIGTKDVGFDNKVSYNNGVAIPKKYEQDFRIAPKDSILMCIEGGSAGRKIAIIKQDVCFGNKLCCFSPFVEIGRYIYYYLQSPSFIDMFNGNKTGIIGGVSIAKAREILIPLPPQQELERIVAKIDEFVASIMSR